jgi:hypothetical protein
VIHISRDLVLSKMPCQGSACGGVLWNGRLVEVNGKSVVRAEEDSSTLAVGLYGVII